MLSVSNFSHDTTMFVKVELEWLPMVLLLSMEVGLKVWTPFVI